MAHLIFALCFVFVVPSLRAQATVWQPAPGHSQMPIWPGAIPNAQPLAGPEISTTTGKEDLVAGKPYVWVERVSQPTVTFIRPRTKRPELR
jgi:hypothetical protein